jgi:predicted nucleic acid-binding protein
MILADTSIWIDHLRSDDAKLFGLLDRNQVLMHPFVIGELALGHMPDRRRALRVLSRMPKARVVGAPEFLRFLEANELISIGIGFVDAHLLAAAYAISGCRLWSRDKRLAAAAERLAIAASL